MPWGLWIGVRALVGGPHPRSRRDKRSISPFSAAPVRFNAPITQPVEARFHGSAAQDSPRDSGGAKTEATPLVMPRLNDGIGGIGSGSQTLVAGARVEYFSCNCS